MVVGIVTKFLQQSRREMLVIMDQGFDSADRGTEMQEIIKEIIIDSLDEEMGMGI